MSTIICGSRKYKDINFDKIVDNFDTIIRNNMLLPNNNYGTKNSNIQVLNCHINQYYKQKTYEGKNVTPEESISVYKDEFDVSEDHIRKFFDYLELDSVEFKHFENNNTRLMIELLNYHGIPHELRAQIRCGLSYIAECINLGIKPFLIGFSLDSNYALNKQYCNIDGKGICHDIESEIDLIKKLHTLGFVDATFCTIEDSEDLRLNDTLLNPTESSLKVLGNVY